MFLSESDWALSSSAVIQIHEGRVSIHENHGGEDLGLKAEESAPGRLVLSADGVTPLLHFEEDAGAPPRDPRTTGLYHFALLVPSRIAGRTSLPVRAIGLALTIALTAWALAAVGAA